MLLRYNNISSAGADTVLSEHVLDCSVVSSLALYGAVSSLSVGSMVLVCCV